MLIIFIDSALFRQLSNAATDNAYDCGTLNFCLLEALAADDCIQHDFLTGDAFVNSADLQSVLDSFCNGIDCTAF